MNRLREWREKRGMTQTELGEAIGSNRIYIYRLESGITRLNEEAMNKIAKVLDCYPQDILSGGESKENSTNSPVDQALMADVSIAIDKVTSRTNIKLSKNEFLDICVDLYNYVQKYRAERENVEVSSALAELFINSKHNGR